jgi:hypothetical protein
MTRFYALNSERRRVEMKTLLATLFAAMVLLVFAGVAGAMSVSDQGSNMFNHPLGPFPRIGNVFVPTRPPQTAGATRNTGGGGTAWYVYVPAAFGGVIVVGGTAYAVYTTAHQHGPHRPVGVH